MIYSIVQTRDHGCDQAKFLTGRPVLTLRAVFSQEFSAIALLLQCTVQKEESYAAKSNGTTCYSDGYSNGCKLQHAITVDNTGAIRVLLRTREGRG